MELFILPRGAGKTTRLVEALLDRPEAVMVVALEVHRDVVRERVQTSMSRRGQLVVIRDEQGRVLPHQPSAQQRIDEVMSRVLSVRDVRRGGLAERDRPPVLVDDLEQVLYELLGARVDTVTTSTL